MSSFSFTFPRVARSIVGSSWMPRKNHARHRLGWPFEASDRVTVWMSIAATVRTEVLVKVQVVGLFENLCLFFR